MSNTKDLIEDFFNEQVPHAYDRWVELSVQIAQEVNRERELKGWSLRQLAREAGIKAPHLSRSLNGQHNFTLQTIAKLETALGVPILEICRREALSFVERGLPAFPKDVEQNSVTKKRLLEKGKVVANYLHPAKDSDGSLAGTTSYAMAA